MNGIVKSKIKNVLAESDNTMNREICNTKGLV